MLFLSGGYFVSCYTAKIKKRHSEYKEILSLLTYISSSLASSTSSVAEILSGFRSDILKKCGLVCSEKSNSEIYLNEEQKVDDGSIMFAREKIDTSELLIDKDDKEKLMRFLREIGKSTLAEEERRVKDIACHFESRENSVMHSSEKETKVAWTLFVCAFFGIAIFVI